MSSTKVLLPAGATRVTVRLPPPVALHRDSTMHEVVQSVLGSAHRVLAEHEVGIRCDASPDHVYKARVATRRLRSEIRTLQPVLDRSWSRLATEEVRWLGGLLGEERNAAVLHRYLLKRSSGTDLEHTSVVRGLAERLEHQRADAHVAVMHAFNGDRYRRLLDGLGTASLTTSGITRTSDAKAPTASLLARRELPRLVKKSWKRLVRGVAELGSDPKDEQLHELRLIAKQARYASALAEPVVGFPAHRLAQGIAKLQTHLGRIQDSSTFELWLAQIEMASPIEAALVGDLIARERAHRLPLHTAWIPAWDNVNQRHLSVWLK